MFHLLTPSLAIAALLPLTAAYGQGEDTQELRQQLEQLREEIAEIIDAQRSRESERDRVQAQLRQSEVELGSLRRQRDSLKARIAETQQQLTELERRRAHLTEAGAAQRDAIAAEVRRAYRSSGSDELKLLLSQEDPQTLARQLEIYRRILGARSALLEEYRTNLEQLQTVESTLADTRKALKHERNQLQEQQLVIAAEQAHRSGLLRNINAALNANAARLEAQQQDQARLEQLLENIEAAVATAPPPQPAQSFSSARGSMSWPVQGSLAVRFGQPRNQGKMRWQGVRLRADAGSTVSAIHHGRVVYADWLRGSGLLLVLDHGEGYMSLYAHNETLLREVGDWVNAGSPISTVGASGGQSEPVLYFEIRKDGKPTNPENWCRR